ncbi:MAG TPA: DUF1289 domain-containing protein [Steroidobacteraceae bacterium]|nr:DUF1289 domain-containing protein [Steroidobacteraceae bacterium]
MPVTRPESPCTKVCTLDGDGFCIGCLRTGEEIGRWPEMSAEDQWRLLEELAERRRRRTTTPGGRHEK